MVWQPIPPPAIWPGRSRVERLCGQPEQKFDGRETTAISRGRAQSHRSMKCIARGHVFGGSAMCRAIRPPPWRSCRDPVRQTAGRAARPRVDFADHDGPRGQAVERVAQMQFQKAALFLDHQNGRQALARIRARTAASSGKVMPNFATRMPSSFRSFVADAQIAQRLRQIVIGFSGARDSKPGVAIRAAAPCQRFSRFSRANSIAACNRRAVHFVLQRQRDRRNQPRVDVSSDNSPEANRAADPDRRSPFRRHRRCR